MTRRLRVSFRVEPDGAWQKAKGRDAGELARSYRSPAAGYGLQRSAAQPHATAEQHSGPAAFERVETVDKIAESKNTVTVSYTGITAEGLPDRGESHEALLTKRIWRDENGALAKQAAANPVRGTFTHFAHTGTAEDVLNAYANVLRSLTPHQAIIAAPLPSPLRNDGSKWRLTTKNAPEPGALPRSQTTFQPVAGPALLSLDFDIPAAAAAGIRDRRRPLSQGAASGMAGLRRSRDAGQGQRVERREADRRSRSLPTGYHVACIVSDGTRIEEFAAALFDRIALLGFALVEAVAMWCGAEAGAGRCRGCQGQRAPDLRSRPGHRRGRRASAKALRPASRRHPRR